jgi:hypothetical protein
LFNYDPDYDTWRTYGTPAVPAALADEDAGRPLELHGAGFRGAWTPATFTESSPYGSSIPGSRNAFPLGFDAAGASRDVSNNITGQFEAMPWAVGETGAVLPGEAVPVDAVFTFAINPTLPGVLSYLQQGLASGRIWFSLSSLHPASQQGGEFASWYTKDYIYHQLFGGQAPTLTIEAELNLPLTISRAGNQVNLSWPEFAGFTHTLQASPDLAAGAWAPVHSHSAIADGPGGFSENTDLPARFYRLAITPTP